MISALVVMCAVILDSWFGKPGRWDPRGGFERLVGGLTRRLRPAAGEGDAWSEADPLAKDRAPTGPAAYVEGCASSLSSADARRGVLALLLVLAVCLPPTALPYLGAAPPVRFVIELAVLYFALGGHSLIEHAREVFGRLLDQAASRVSGRAGGKNGRAGAADPGQVAVTTIGHLFGEAGFAVFGVLFWYLVAGVPGVVGFRVVHGLAGMWRGHGARAFSRPVECLDWLVSWLPLYLAALTYLLLGRWRGVWTRWRDCRYGSGAQRLSRMGLAALGLCPPASRPPAGGGDAGPSAACATATESDIFRAVGMVEQGTWIWVGVAVILGALLA